MWHLIDFKPISIEAKTIAPILMSHRVVYHGFDKVGRPCMLVRPRFHKPGEYPMEDMVRYGIFQLERILRKSSE